ncbi:MAG: diphosphomevalonate decarboxylase [Deltaproteobacteria bacterium]|nr:diphosphomevalonate decarboxylase [Deltaproteobacteria bacterium]
MRAKARACANVALVKYWGKRDVTHNLPAAPSVSLTLAALTTDTEVVFDAGLDADVVSVDGKHDAGDSARVSRFLDQVRGRAGFTTRARVTSANTFPTGAGLASSASGFAALAVAAARAASLALSETELSIVARLGSGSAPRSLFGGFVEMRAGVRADGSDAVARPIAAPEHWPLEVLVVVTTEAKKAVASGAGMQRSRETSPFYQSFIRGSDDDVRVARQSILGRDFEALAAVAQASCLKMHAVMLSSRPALIYWNSATLAVMHAVMDLQQQGVPAFFTIDAGPQVKVVCPPNGGAKVAAALAAVSGVARVIPTALGPAARLLEDGP